MPEWDIFQKNHYYKNSCTSWPVSLYKNFKHILGADPELWYVIFVHVWPTCSKQKKSFKRKTVISFWSNSLAFILQNFIRTLWFQTMHHFWAQNEPIGPKKNFFLKTTNIILIYFLFSFIKQIFEKFLVKADPEWPSRLWHCNLNWKVPGSSPTRCSIGLRDPTLLRDS